MTRNPFALSCRALLCLCTSVLIAACANDAKIPGFLSPDQQYWTFALNTRALTLSTVAPYDTFRLAATPRDANDAPIAGEFHSTFRVVSGSDNVRVDSITGLVTALAPTIDRQARILVGIFDGHATHEDTVFVRVTPTGPASPLAGLTVHLPPGVPSPIPSMDANPYAVPLGLGGVELVVEAPDALGNPIVDPWVNFTSSDSLVATVDSSGRMRGHAPGVVTITATTTLFGVTRSDSLQLTFGPPLTGAFGITARTPVASQTPVPYFTVGTQTVSRGAVVYWNNKSGLDVDITFDDPSAARAIPDSLNVLHQFFAMNVGLQDGNIPQLLASDPTSYNGVGVDGRYFPQPGTYVFRSQQYPTLVDTLIVQ